MKSVFVVADGYGWGKGESLSEAMKNYTRLNHNMSKGQKYHLTIIQTNNPDGVWRDEWSVHFSKGDTKIYSGIETK